MEKTVRSSISEQGSLRFTLSRSRMRSRTGLASPVENQACGIAHLCRSNHNRGCPTFASFAKVGRDVVGSVETLTLIKYARTLPSISPPPVSSSSLARAHSPIPARARPADSAGHCSTAIAPAPRPSLAPPGFDGCSAASPGAFALSTGRNHRTVVAICALRNRRRSDQWQPRTAAFPICAEQSLV